MTQLQIVAVVSIVIGIAIGFIAGWVARVMVEGMNKEIEG